MFGPAGVGNGVGDGVDVVIKGGDPGHLPEGRVANTDNRVLAADRLVHVRVPPAIRSPSAAAARAR
jgi:hypothetical protein